MAAAGNRPSLTMGWRPSRFVWLAGALLAAVCIPAPDGIAHRVGLVSGALAVILGALTGSALTSLAFVSPLLGVSGGGALLFTGCLALFFDGRTGIFPRWIRPFALVIGANLLGELLLDLRLAGHSFDSELAAAGGSSPFVQYLTVLQASYPSFVGGLGAMIRLAVFGALFDRLQGDEDARRGVVSGVVWGACAAIVVSVAVWAFPESLSLPNYTPLWRSLGRLPGTFSDPNAFGVGAVMLVVMLGAAIDRKAASPTLLGAVGAAWCGTALVSGSRTFFIGLGVLCLAAVWQRARWRSVAWALGGIAALIVWINIAQPSGASLGVGGRRLVESVQWGRIEEAFRSRTIFWSVAAAVWSDHPILGIGLARFPDVVGGYSASLGVDLRGWSDNPNSYYLGILAELGLVGFIGWLLAVRSLRWRGDNPERRWGRWGCLAMGVMLVFGPHLDFDDVSLLFCFVLALGVEIVRPDVDPLGRIDRRGWLVRGALAVLVVVCVVGDRSLADWGLYRWERDERGAFQWTRGAARIRVECSQEGTAQVVVRALEPSPQGWPVQVVARTPLGSEAAELNDLSEYTLAVPCRWRDHPVWASPESTLVNLTVSPVWVPAAVGGSGDHRLLGVQLRRQ